MQTYKLTSQVQTYLSDTITPVAAYLRLRQFFPPAILLESSDYRASENSFSYICCDPIAEITLTETDLVEKFPDGTSCRRDLTEPGLPRQQLINDVLSGFIRRFEVEPIEHANGVINGLFGYLAYDAVQYMEDIRLHSPPLLSQQIPLMHYAIYRYVLAIDHFRDRLYILQNTAEPGTAGRDYNIYNLASKPDFKPEPFRAVGEAQSQIDDARHLALIDSCKQHIYRGDIFQIVPSRKFSQKFSGDDFNVYRALRSINPSPYLFYFDCDSFHLFGSSPEAQIMIKGNKASIFPIAGTYPRSGDDTQDTLAAGRLLEDPKENAEHVMLVDLARNDLSIHCHPVKVEKYREIQLFSHVIHIVSTVSGTLYPDRSPISVLTSTFPAGTLSGAPKYKAMQLIDRYETSRRHFYGGAIGFIGFNGDINHAIAIRSFLSRDQTLHFQAGGGVVADSVPENEVQEVKNKLAALRAAIKMAEEI